MIQTALANPLDKFELGIRKLIEDLMIERMGENDKIVTRYMADSDFQGSAFPILARGDLRIRLEDAPGRFSSTIGTIRMPPLHRSAGQLKL